MIKQKITALAILILGVVVLSGCNNGIPEANDFKVNIGNITGVTAPAYGETPVTAITETDQYTGTVIWSGSPVIFDASTVYTATITLTAKSGYTLTGATENYFAIAGATSVINSVDSGVVTAVFPEATVTIGDSVFGGIVVYIMQSGDPGYIEGEQHGLIAATEDQSTGIVWAVVDFQGTAAGSTETALGTGSANTDNIIAQNDPTSSGLITFAAGLARAYNGGGYTDWYLPSKDELNLLHSNKVAIGATIIEWYWSSSEDNANATNAWFQYFQDGSQINVPKTETYRVRSVRMF